MATKAKTANEQSVKDSLRLYLAAKAQGNTRSAAAHLGVLRRYDPALRQKAYQSMSSTEEQYLRELNLV
jgi:hypothetical protein